MTVKSLVAVVAPRTGKIVRNGLRVFEIRENFLQNCILHFVFNLYQSSCLKVRIYTDEKLTFQKGFKVFILK